MLCPHGTLFDCLNKVLVSREKPASNALVSVKDVWITEVAFMPNLPTFKARAPA